MNIKVISSMGLQSNGNVEYQLIVDVDGFTFNPDNIANYDSNKIQTINSTILERLKQYLLLCTDPNAPATVMPSAYQTYSDAYQLCLSLNENTPNSIDSIIEVLSENLNDGTIQITDILELFPVVFNTQQSVTTYSI